MDGHAGRQEGRFRRQHAAARPLPGLERRARDLAFRPGGDRRPHRRLALRRAGQSPGQYRAGRRRAQVRRAQWPLRERGRLRATHGPRRGRDQRKDPPRHRQGAARLGLALWRRGRHHAAHRRRTGLSDGADAGRRPQPRGAAHVHAAHAAGQRPHDPALRQQRGQHRDGARDARRARGPGLHLRPRSGADRPQPGRAGAAHRGHADQHRVPAGLRRPASRRPGALGLLPEPLAAHAGRPVQPRRLAAAQPRRRVRLCLDAGAGAGPGPVDRPRGPLGPETARGRARAGPRPVPTAVAVRSGRAPAHRRPVRRPGAPCLLRRHPVPR